MECATYTAFSSLEERQDTIIICTHPHTLCSCEIAFLKLLHVGSAADFASVSYLGFSSINQIIYLNLPTYGTDGSKSV